MTQEELVDALNMLSLQNARIAIVSWDDNDTMDEGDMNTTLNPQWLNPQGSFTERLKISRTLGNYSNKTCKETDLTVYEVGLQKAIRVMSARINLTKDDPLNCATKRFIIFITSRSEFKGLQPNSTIYSISKTLNQSGGFQGVFPFYIGTNLTDYPLESKNLTTIAQFSGASGPVRLTALNLTNTIQGKMECHDQPWINNVTLVDTLYPYLKYNSANPSPSAVKPNKDGTTTLEWNIRAINSSKRWTTTIDTSVQMKLPVDVTSNRTRFGGNISPDTPYSRVEFDWPALGCANRTHNVMNLPEGKLWITCGAPCQAPKVVTVPAPQQNATNAEPPKKQPGFEGLFSLLALITGGYLWKKH